MSRNRLIRCLNCDVIGHTFQSCSNPIRSYGVIAYKETEDGIKYLLIQRKDTIGYTDFMRGKYRTNSDINIGKMKILLEEMTIEERKWLSGKDFDTLWDSLWLNHSKGIYVNEKNKAKRFFQDIVEKINLENIECSKYTESEYGFAKGRKNLNESGLECAKREFEEETGLHKEDYTIIDEVTSIKENFIGSDGKNYTHIYYIAKINNEIDISKVHRSFTSLEEVKKIELLDYKHAYKKIRNYDTEKKSILTRINKYINSNLLSV